VYPGPVALPPRTRLYPGPAPTTRWGRPWSVLGDPCAAVVADGRTVAGSPAGVDDLAEASL